MALAASLTQFDLSVLQITNLPDASGAFLADQANFTGGHTHLGIFTFFCQKLSRRTGGTDQLRAGAFTNFHIVNHGANRESLKSADSCLC